MFDEMNSPSDKGWCITQSSFYPEKQHHQETIFTIGNGYLCTRGAFEEGYPGDRRATFIHGVFDHAPIAFTELANAPDWLPLTVWLNGERFSLDAGRIESFARVVDLRNGLLKRSVRWHSPSGSTANLVFERFASLANPHLVLLRCSVTPEFNGRVEFRAGINGNMDNQGLMHWEWLGQGSQGQTAFLHCQTRSTKIQTALAMRLISRSGQESGDVFWDVENYPTRVLTFAAESGQTLVVEKYAAFHTSRDLDEPVYAAVAAVNRIENWSTALNESSQTWHQEWERTDVIIDGDEEAQIAVRFNLFQMLIAAPRNDDRVNIGAKSLSGFGYRGHAFWDTEIFMLPLFTFTAPHIAKNLLNYRFRNLPGARAKAIANGFEGAQFPWESADTGEEVTPTWVPHFKDPTKLVRIWTGDIEIHISADIAFATHQYWTLTGDDDWMAAKGTEIVLDTAKFWASRAEWDTEKGHYAFNDVIGPDENHDHVDNNAFTNRMAKWNLETAFEILAWLQAYDPAQAAKLREQLDLTPQRMSKWRKVIDKLYVPGGPGHLIEQFDGYFQLEDVDLETLEPRRISVQELYGIEGAARTKVIKQPDVLMLQYLLADEYTPSAVQENYNYYTPRTDHSHGSSLGPSIQAIMACRVGQVDEAYSHFIRAVRADLRDVRGNAGDGIHAASAGGTWQTIVFGFGGLRLHPAGWEVQPRLPGHWKRLAFKFFYQGEMQTVELRPEVEHGT